MVDKSNRRIGITQVFATSLAILLLGVLMFGLTALSLAQGEDEPTWQPPINLSKSGVATEPQVVVDFSGRIHALWREDAIHGYVYTHEDGDGGWTRPLPLELPFATRRWFDEEELGKEEPTPLFDPTLVADKTGRIHAFWKNEDAEMFYSQVGVNRFDQFSNWTLPVKVATGASAIVGQVDDAGRIHIAYINPVDTADSPSGIYYRSTSTNAPSWTSSELLFDSTYFRAMSEEDANLQMQLAPDGGIWVGWENPIIEQLFLVGSSDSGQSWGDVLIVDRRNETDKLEAQGPTKLRVTIAGDVFHVFWQAGHANELCNQYHSYSVDQGINWTFPEILPAVEGCPLEVHAIGFPNDPTVVFLAVETNETKMIAWNGSEWSLPQSQPLHLGALEDSKTFQTVTLDCQKPFLMNEQKLVITGCDHVAENEREPVRDNWLLERSLTDMESWFAPPGLWSEPTTIATLMSDNVNFTMHATDTSQFHAFWEALNAKDVHYTQVQAGQSSGITKLFDDVTNLAVAIDQQGQYVMAWPDSNGQLMFSKADSARVSALSEWSQPLELPSPRTGVSEAAIGVAPDGKIVVVYAIPVNEERGVYVTTSSDDGESWSDFVRVFDAEAANWTAVSNPRLTFTYPNYIHLTWMHTDALGETVQSLFYARSHDSGLTWREPEDVDSNVARSGSQIVWNDLVGFGEQVVHRLWQTKGNGRITVWHQVSADGGASWSDTEPVIGDLGATDLAAPVTLTYDDSGRLILVSVIADQVRQHVWQGEKWIEGEAFVLPENKAVISLGAAISPDDNLGVMLALRATDIKDENSEITFTNAQLKPSDMVLQTVPQLTPTPLPSPTMTPTPGPQPTPTIVFPVDRSDSWGQSLGLPPANNAIFQAVSGIMPGFLLALFFVLLVFFVGLRIARHR